MFDRYTHQKAGNRRRMLLVDRHSSHLNIAFINVCDHLRILLMILPPHATHRLQPLDVSLFSPLARYYTNRLNDLLFKSLGLVSMSKRSFWKVFWPAWNEAFCVENITSVYTKTGLWPFNPAIILDKITLTAAQQDTATTIQEIKMPTTCRAVRRFQKAYIKNPDPQLLTKLFQANLYLASQHSIDRHIEIRLTKALRDEKKRRRHSKRLNLVGEDKNGPQFFSLCRIQAARDYQESKDTKEALQQQAITDKKVAIATKKLQKEKEKEKRVQNTAVRRQIQTKAAAQKAAKKLAL